MRHTADQFQLLGAILAAATALCGARAALGQVEILEPNPTQPYDIDTDFSYGPSGGAKFGRAPSKPGQPRDENPAETLLRGMEGTNYGRYTGHAVAIAPRGGRPENAWRYRFHRGRWWYLTPSRRWSYFDGRRWRPYSRR